MTFLFLIDLCTKNIFSSETTVPVGNELYRSDDWKVLYNKSPFHIDPTQAIPVSDWPIFKTKTYSKTTLCYKSQILTEM
jgi:hypothetical protein